MGMLHSTSRTIWQPSERPTDPKDKEKRKDSKSPSLPPGPEQKDPIVPAVPFKFHTLNERDTEALRNKLCTILGVKSSDRSDPAKASTFEQIDEYTIRYSNAEILAQEFSLDYYQDKLDARTLLLCDETSKFKTQEIERREFGAERKAEEAWEDVPLVDEQQGQYIIKVKLIITETTYFSLFPNAFNRFIQRQVQMNYGLMHTALLFGDKVVDWGNSSVVTPREVSAFQPKLTIDLCNINLEKDQEKLWRMCNKIVEWNARTYSATMANCQCFVNEVLEAMEIKLQMGGALEKALQKLKTNGRLEMEYSPPQELHGETVTFDTHEDLDNYVHYIIKQIPDFQHRHKYDWALLKAYDRAFWLTFYDRGETDPTKRKDNLAKGRPCKDQCPFIDPRDTGTLLGQKE